MTRELRGLLARPGRIDAFEARIATDEDLRALRPLFIPHVRDVLVRVDAAAGDEVGALWPVKLTALVHEVPLGHCRPSWRLPGSLMSRDRSWRR